MPGAEPYSAAGDSRGALVLHGFTGNPQSMRDLALVLSDAGFTVELPLLPGHGTDIADMLPTRWEDWSAAAEEAYDELAARSDAVVVVGLSMGGLLAVWLAERHPEIAALAVVNPLLAPPDADVVALVESMLESGEEVAPGIGSDIAKEGVAESAYPGLPLRPALSLFAAATEVSANLESVTCPVLVFTSTQDHVVDPASSQLLVERAKGPVDQVVLERSYHVATLDHDKDEIEARTVEFLSGVLPSPSAPSGARS
jgi:carboxylesterase